MMRAVLSSTWVSGWCSLLIFQGVGRLTLMDRAGSVLSRRISSKLLLSWVIPMGFISVMVSPTRKGHSPSSFLFSVCDIADCARDRSRDIIAGYSFFCCIVIPQSVAFLRRPLGVVYSRVMVLVMVVVVVGL